MGRIISNSPSLWGCSFVKGKYKYLIKEITNSQKQQAQIPAMENQESYGDVMAH